MLSTGVPSRGCPKTSVRQYIILNIILNIRKSSLIGSRIIMDVLIDNIKCNYKN